MLYIALNKLPTRPEPLGPKQALSICILPADEKSRGGGSCGGRLPPRNQGSSGCTPQVNLMVLVVYSCARIHSRQKIRDIRESHLFNITQIVYPVTENAFLSKDGLSHLCIRLVF